MRRAKVQALCCNSCDAVIDGTPPFCDVCGRPTPFATYEDTTAWEVAQWRAHNGGENGNGSAATNGHVAGRTRSTASAVMDRPVMPPEADVAPWQRRLAQREAARAEREAQAARAASEAPQLPPETIARPVLDSPTDTPPPVPIEPPPVEYQIPAVVETTSEAAPADEPEPAPARLQAFRSWFSRDDDDLDRPITYRRCLECGGADWVLRAGGADDETYRYWCVRCGSAFHTDLRLRPAFKPWLISATVILAVVLGMARFV